MTLEEARETFLNRGWIKAEGGTYFDGDKWREAVMVISDYLQKEQCEDCISRKGVFIPDITVEMFRNASLESIEDLMASGEMEDILLPPAQPEVKQISYTDCANAMLMMWMDKVLTDGEYNRIMDKLNEHKKKKGNDNG